MAKIVRDRLFKRNWKNRPEIYSTIMKIYSKILSFLLMQFFLRINEKSHSQRKMSSVLRKIKMKFSMRGAFVRCKGKGIAEVASGIQWLLH